MTLNSEETEVHGQSRRLVRFTRHTHNETVWERRNISGDEMFKKQPSYIVYFVDNFEDRLTDPEAMRQWESVKKAAENGDPESQIDLGSSYRSGTHPNYDSAMYWFRRAS